MRHLDPVAIHAPVLRTVAAGAVRGVRKCPVAMTADSVSVRRVRLAPALDVAIVTGRGQLALHVAVEAHLLAAPDIGTVQVGAVAVEAGRLGLALGHMAPGEDRMRAVVGSEVALVAQHAPAAELLGVEHRDIFWIGLMQLHVVLLRYEQLLHLLA